MNAVPHPELLNTLLALLTISLASLLGSVSFAFGRRLQAMLPYLLAAASGILIATAVTHLLPEAIEHLKDLRETTVLFLGGLVSSFLLERLTSMVLHHPEGDHVHGLGMVSPKRSLTTSILLSGALHSFVDGVAIAIAFAVGHQVGIATTVAVFLHEVPHHVANVGVLIYAGLTRGRAILLNLLATSGCATGGMLVLFFGLKSPAFSFMVLPVAAANFLYIGVAILLPEMHREKDRRRSLVQMVSFVIAAAAMTALSYWEPI